MERCDICKKRLTKYHICKDLKKEEKPHGDIVEKLRITFFS